MQLFGFEIKRKDESPLESFAPEIKDDGAVVVAAGGAYGTYVDLGGTARTEAELVAKYREISMQPEIDMAIDDIVNEAVDIDAEDIVQINLDKVKYSDAVKSKIKEEFNNVLLLLNFQKEAYEVFRRWYIDGRMYYHVIIDEKNPRQGIAELRYIDPRKIRKIREVSRKPKGMVTVSKTRAEYYLYSDRTFLAQGGNAGMPVEQSSTGGLRIAPDSILHVTSGLMDGNNQMVYSYLQKAIKALNQLRTLEDATVIYRISRAPERRIFYIDVGNLPKVKAEQYLKDMMTRHKNRLVYDGQTGEVRDDRKYMTMLEDYWLPRREGNKGTEITTLPAGQNLGEMDDVLYFQKKLYQSLNVPVSRLESGQGFNLGRAAEISRDEVKFTKFVGRMRRRFSTLFLKALEKQLVLKGIVSEDDWHEISNDINFDYHIDNHFEEFKDAEVIANRISLLNQVHPYIGQYYSQKWIKKNILKLSEDDMEEMQKEMDEEATAPPTAAQQVQIDQEQQAQQEKQDQQQDNEKEIPATLKLNVKKEDVQYEDYDEIYVEEEVNEVDLKKIELMETMTSYLKKE
jgi:ribosomal protein L12E/L44/L45/RPP1/RPP2